MALKNPNKYIKAKYLTLLAGIGFPVFDKRLPIGLSIPQTYALIQSQSKTETNRTKCDKLWRSETTIDIYTRALRGTADSSILDDVEESITDVLAPDVQTDIQFDNFKTYNTFIMQPQDAPIDTPTETILHRVLRFQHIVGAA
jgi:hypothetical protein